jgi:hypothetical protein
MWTDPQPLLLPLNCHLHKNSIDPTIILIRIQIDHPDLLVFILKQKEPIVCAEI